MLLSFYPLCIPANQYKENCHETREINSISTLFLTSFYICEGWRLNFVKVSDAPSTSISKCKFCCLVACTSTFCRWVFCLKSFWVYPQIFLPGKDVYMFMRHHLEYKQVANEIENNNIIQRCLLHRMQTMQHILYVFSRWTNPFFRWCIWFIIQYLWLNTSW